VIGEPRYDAAEYATVFLLVASGVFLAAGAIIGASAVTPGPREPLPEAFPIAGIMGLGTGVVAVVFMQVNVVRRSALVGPDGGFIWTDVLLYGAGVVATTVGEVPLYLVGVFPPIRPLGFVPVLLPSLGGTAMIYAYRRDAVPLPGWLAGGPWTGTQDKLLFAAVCLSVLIYSTWMLGVLSKGFGLAVGLLAGFVAVGLRGMGTFQTTGQRASVD
jgi:hypothetical protein